MSISLATLVQEFEDLIINAHHVDDAYFSSIDGIENCSKDSLIFAETLEHVPDHSVAAVVTNADVGESLAKQGRVVLVVENVRLAQAKLKQAYQDYDSSDAEWEQIHPSAIIHPTAQIGHNVRIGPNVVIGKDVKIGDECRIRANAVIEHGVIMGRSCVINAQVNIGYNCTIGNRVNLHSGVVIGNEGFGFAQDHSRTYHRIPHTGWVELGDDVQIGANSNVDRGTYGATIIGNGVKLDGLCHIAHNVHIDEGALLAAQAGVAGSTHIGKGVMASGQVGILDHLKIADNVVLVHRTGVTESIDKPGMYAGLPAKPFKEYVRGLGLGRRLDKLAMAIKELKSHKN